MNIFNQRRNIKLHMLPLEKYKGGDENDPIRYYYWPILGGLYRKRVEMCLSECQGGKRILEVGFGSGVCFLNLKDLYSEIYGIDLITDIHHVEMQFSDLAVPLNLQNGNVLHINFPERFFDTVLLISILEHLQPAEQIQAFSEIHRVLKPGGQVIFGTPIERSFMVRMFRLMGVDIRKHHFSTHQEITKAAENIFGKGNIQYLHKPLVGNIYLVGEFRRSQNDLGVEKNEIYYTK